ncbi:MAG: tetratricopeptide repeat protein [Candidatus Acidiferrales bacterium]
MKSFWKMIAAFVLAALILPSPAGAQGHGNANLKIRVDVRFEDNRSAPAGVIVDLEYGDGVPYAHSQTDSGGKCNFIPDTATIYYVRAKQPGYLEATQRLDLQNSQDGYAILILKRDPKHPAPADTPGTTISAAELSIPDAAKKEFDKATEALQNHDLDGGVSHLKKAIELHAQYPQAYTMLGSAYNQQKKWSDAQGALQKAIQQDPNEADAYFQLGATLNQQKDFAGAEKALKQGFQLVPEPAEGAAAHYELAFACFSQGRWQEAEPQAAKTIAAQQDFALAHWLMAQIMLKKGDGQGAINEFQTYLKLDPNGPAAPSVRAVIPKIQAAIAKK